MMDYKELKRITNELERKDRKIDKLKEEIELLKCDKEQLFDEMSRAMNGDYSYKEVESTGVNKEYPTV